MSSRGFFNAFADVWLLDGVRTPMVDDCTALEVADYGYVLEMGEQGLNGPAAELAKDPRVIDTHLGAARKAA